MSLTLEDTMTLASTLMMQAKGARTVTATIQNRLGIKNKLKRAYDHESRIAADMAAAMQVTPIHGMKAAKLLPSNNSPSVVGVANRGSRLFSTFSPTKLYEAMIEGKIAAIRIR